MFASSGCSSFTCQRPKLIPIFRLQLFPFAECRLVTECRTGAYSQSVNILEWNFISHSSSSPPSDFRNDWKNSSWHAILFKAPSLRLLRFHWISFLGADADGSGEGRRNTLNTFHLLFCFHSKHFIWINKIKKNTQKRKKTIRAFRIETEFRCGASAAHSHLPTIRFWLQFTRNSINHCYCVTAYLYRILLIRWHFVDQRMDKLLPDWRRTIRTWHNEHTSN